jgi:hypothetical protein
MQPEPIIELRPSLLDDPCRFVRRACQLADYGDPARDEQPAAVPAEHVPGVDRPRVAEVFRSTP